MQTDALVERRLAELRRQRGDQTRLAQPPPLEEKGEVDEFDDVPSLPVKRLEEERRAALQLYHRLQFRSNRAHKTLETLLKMEKSAQEAVGVARNKLMTQMAAATAPESDNF